MRLSKTQRYFAADKLMDSANFALTGLVFGQLVAENIHPILLILGLLLYLLGWFQSLHLRKGAK